MAPVLGCLMKIPERVSVMGMGIWGTDGGRAYAGRQLCEETGNYRKGIPFLTDGKAKVLAQDGGVPTLTVNKFGSGMGIYMASFEKTNRNTRLLLNLICLREEKTGTGFT